MKTSATDTTINKSITPEQPTPFQLKVAALQTKKPKMKPYPIAPIYDDIYFEGIAFMETL